MNKFKDKVIWITGASSGIGEALAKEFSALEAIIILSSRNETELQRVAGECKISNDRYMILPFDLADTSHVIELTKRIISRFGKIDVLVNNGGFSQRSEALKTEMRTVRELMEVNFFSSVALSSAVLPHMINQRSGQLVVVSSVAGKFGFFLRSSYAAAKHALHGYFESLRLETESKGIKTLIVCPGKIKTNISVNAIGENGIKHNAMDPSHVNAMSAEVCAKKIIGGIIAQKEEIFVGGKELRAVWMKRFFPRLFSILIKKQNPL